MAYANVCGNMPCWTKIYAIFWDRHRARFPEKNSKTWEHIQNDGTLRSGFFFRKTRSVTVPRFGFFFQNSRIRVKWFNLRACFLKTFLINLFSYPSRTNTSWISFIQLQLVFFQFSFVCSENELLYYIWRRILLCFCKYRIFHIV